MTVAGKQTDLFGQSSDLPGGFRYQPELIDETEAATLLPCISALPFKEFQFHGFLGKRRVVSFGWRYDFNGGGLTKTHDMPAFLLDLRAKAAALAGLRAADLQHLLVTSHAPRNRALVGLSYPRPSALAEGCGCRRVAQPQITLDDLVDQNGRGVSLAGLGAFGDWLGGYYAGRRLSQRRGQEGPYAFI